MEAIGYSEEQVGDGSLVFQIKYDVGQSQGSNFIHVKVVVPRVESEHDLIIDTVQLRRPENMVFTF